jgi:phage replication O-like protein O
MSGFQSPNYTQTPNDLFDRLMAEMSHAELLVVLAAIRQTLGYHKASDEISLTQFERMTGMTRKGVVGGIKAAIERGVLHEVSRGKRGVVRYQLVVESNQLPEATSYRSTPELVTAVHQSQGTTSYRRKHTKEKDSLKKDSKEILPNGNGVEYNGRVPRSSSENGADREETPTSKEAPTAASATPTPPGAAAPPSPKRTHYDVYLALLAQWQYDPEKVTEQKKKEMMRVAMDLHRVDITPEQVPTLYTFIAKKAEKENWKAWTVNVLPKYANDFLKALPAANADDGAVSVFALIKKQQGEQA